MFNRLRLLFHSAAFSLKQGKVMAVHVDIIGSSFVKRFDRFVHTRGQDGHFVDPARVNLGFAYDAVRVRMNGVSGLTVQSLRQKYDPEFQKFIPDIVVCHAGGNDLARRDSLSVAADIFDFGELVTECYGVEHFIVCSTLRRYSTRADKSLKFGISEEDFALKAAELNLRLSHFFDSEKLHFWQLSTLMGPVTGPAAIDNDGVHLNDTGLKKYFREIRGLILKYSNRLHAERRWSHNF